ncbi:TetR/AcrR family transcriptional regulator [Candidatus Poribacteria bacterium]|nr:TetR/AcrR family transcriptional regulator [Candidatus Poribacteria bacterium]
MLKTTTHKYSRRDRERLARIELILDAAEKLFLQKGFGATTMNDIGEAAEFCRASLYNYFPAKEMIYVSILERAMDSLVAEARKATSQASTASAKIEALKDTLLSFVRRRQAFFHLYFITRSEAGPYLGDDLANRLESKTKELDNIFHDVFREGVAKGEFDPRDRMAMGDIFFAQIIGLVMLNKTETLNPPLEANVNQATSFFLDSIRKKQGKANAK